MDVLFALILLAVVVWVLVRWLGPRVGAGSGFKCKTCRHCRKVYDDGVMCRYLDKQVFKNPAQINMCPDHERR